MKETALRDFGPRPEGGEQPGKTYKLPVDRDDVLLGFGETIMRFQFLEMTFFSILAIGMKKGITLDQGMTKFTGWTTQNMGRLVGTLGLPEDLKD